MKNKIIDLTQTISEGVPDWDGCCGFQMNKILDYADGACVQEIKTCNGIGTHIDAPSHFIEGGLDISNISLEKLVCPAVVIDVSHKTTSNRDSNSASNYALSYSDVIDFEKTYGSIPEKSIVIGNTGWGTKWGSPKDYRQADLDGHMNFPKFSIEAIDYLLEKNINGIAIDTLSPDGGDMNFPVHHQILGAGKFIIENIKIPKELPNVGFTMISLPIKIKNATEAPCRVIAVLDGL